LYEPAAASAVRLVANGAAAAAGLAEWRRRVEHAWKNVAVTAVDVDESGAASGTRRPVRVGVDLGGLDRADVRVEIVHGPLGHDGEFHGDVTTVELQPAPDGTYAGDVTAGVAGSYGVTARVIPVHPDLASPFDTGKLAWAT